MQDKATGPRRRLLILKYGQKVNLDIPSFTACVSHKNFLAASQKHTDDEGTLVISHTAKDRIDGVRIVGAVPYTVFDSAIKNMLSKQPP